MAYNFKDLTGQKIGDWTVLKRCPNSIKKTMWICQCTCGAIKAVRASHLSSGNSTKCKDCHNYFFNKKHGMYNTKIYGIWEAMKGRCHNPKDANFSSYGGRGIFVCDEWKLDFLNFLADMGLPPKNHSLDRIDNDQGYSANNCRWATRSTQQFNRRVSHKPGNVYRTWKYNFPIKGTNKGSFTCIKCEHEWITERFYVFSERAAECKCTKVHPLSQ